MKSESNRPPLSDLAARSLLPTTILLHVRRPILYIFEIDFHGGFLFPLLGYYSSFADDEEEDNKDCGEETKDSISMSVVMLKYTKGKAKGGTHTTLMITGIPVFCQVLTGIAPEQLVSLHCCLLMNSTIERVRSVFSIVNIMWSW